MLVPGVEVSHESDENGRQLGPPEGGLLTLNVVPGGKLEELVEEDDRQRELHDGHPLGEGEVGNLENVLKDEKENRVSVGNRDAQRETMSAASRDHGAARITTYRLGISCFRLVI